MNENIRDSRGDAAFERERLPALFCLLSNSPREINLACLLSSHQLSVYILHWMGVSKTH